MATSNPTPITVKVSGKHVDVGDALRTRIQDELNAGVGKYFERGGTAEVVVSRDGHFFCVDTVMLLASGQQLVARGQGPDAHAAFSQALNKIETRVRRYKRRLKNHHAQPSARERVETLPYAVLRAPEALDEGDEGEDWGADGSAGHGAPEAMIIAESQAEVKTMTVMMAVMELDLTGAPLVLFRNAAHGGMAVVYRRNDGNIGWIDPQRTAAKAGRRPPPGRAPRPPAGTEL